jgi:hypothetical protein
MMSYRWFIRMSRWARNPPSDTQVKLVLGVMVVSRRWWKFEGGVISG